MIDDVKTAGINTVIGIVGTFLSMTISQWVGIATIAYMITATAKIIKNWHKD